MKKLLPIILLLISINITAQQTKKELIQSIKVYFITENLDLSEKESKEFWPIYNTYEKEISNIRYKESRVIRKEIDENLETMTDEKAKNLLNRQIQAEISIHKSKIKLIKNLSAILAPKKVLSLKMVEEKFKMKILQEYKKRSKVKK